VSIKMAKEQNLSLSPTKISGLCGRLMCCLQYEESCYEQMHKLMPRTGKEIETPDGVGIVVENNVITERTRVKLTAEDGTIDIKEYPYMDLGPGAKERALQRAAEAIDAPEGANGEGATPLRQSSQFRQSRSGNRQPRRAAGEQAAQNKDDKPQPKTGDQKPKGDKPQQRGDKPQSKGDKPQNSKGDTAQNNKDKPQGNKGDKPQNQNRNKPNRDKQPKPEAPAPKAEAKEPPAVQPAASEAGTATVPFSRKRRSGNRRRSFGPKTPGGSGGQMV